MADTSKRHCPLDTNSRQAANGGFATFGCDAAMDGMLACVTCDRSSS